MCKPIAVGGTWEIGPELEYIALPSEPACNYINYQSRNSSNNSLDTCSNAAIKFNMQILLIHIHSQGEVLGDKWEICIAEKSCIN